MAHSLTTGLRDATLAAVLMPIIFCEIDTPDGNVYMWSGVGSLSWNGHTWTGLGEFGGISPTTESTDLQASGVALTLNGFDSSLISVAMDSVKRFWPVKLWLGALDSNFAVIADPYQFHYGLTDTASMQADGKTASIVVTSESRLVAMRQPRERRYTDQDQRIECPGDGGFKYVDSLQNMQVRWGDTTVGGSTSTAAPAATSSGMDAFGG